MADEAFWTERFGGAATATAEKVAEALTSVASDSSRVPADAVLVVKYGVPGAVDGVVSKDFFYHFIGLHGAPEEALVKAHDNLFRRGELCEWYHGVIPKDNARKLLESREIGAFLVRLSESQPDSFVVQVQRGGRIRQQLLKRTGGGYVGQLEGDGKGTTFASVQDYVRSTAKLKTPIRSALASKFEEERAHGGEEAASGYATFDAAADAGGGGGGGGGYGMMGGGGDGGAGAYSGLDGTRGGGGGAGGGGYGLFDANAASGNAGGGGGGGYDLFDPNAAGARGGGGGYGAMSR